MGADAWRTMSAAASTCAVAFEPSCGMLWVALLAAVYSAATPSRAVMMFQAAAMSMVFTAVQTAPSTVLVAYAYASFFLSLDEARPGEAV